MKPLSLSASALNTFELCPARYHAENIERSRGAGSDAASLGTSVHGALELFVMACYINKTEEPTLPLLIDLYKLSYSQTFGVYDYETELYYDGYKLVCDWFARTKWDGVRVVSCEVKDNFPVPTSIGEIPFNYIWDRFDEHKPGEFRVVDYKTNRWGVQPSDLKKKIQARAYGLAAAIQLKKEGVEYKRIWVEFDMLRHSGPVGISFSREENAATWRFLKDSAQAIVDMPDDDLPEKLNDQCLFCVRKVSCDALRKNILVGGIHSLPTIEDKIDLRAQLEWQKKGLESLIKDMDKAILAEAKERDLEEFESDMSVLKIGVSRQRAVDPDMVKMALGEELFSKYGGVSFTMATVDKLLKGKELTADQKRDLKGLIYNKIGNPSVKVEPKNPIDDD